MIEKINSLTSNSLNKNSKSSHYHKKTKVLNKILFKRWFNCLPISYSSTSKITKTWESRRWYHIQHIEWMRKERNIGLLKQYCDRSISS